MTTESTTWLFKAKHDEDLNLFFKDSFFGFGGFEDSIDVSKFNSIEEFKTGFKVAFKKNEGNEKVQGFYWWFFADVKVGDDVYICRDEVVLKAYGKISGQYKFNKTSRSKDSPGIHREDFAHSISVDWKSLPLKHLDLKQETGYKWAHPVRELSDVYRNNPTRLIEFKNNFMSKHPLNLISYGPPGTGKTYHTITRSVAICDERSHELVGIREESRPEIEKRYSQLCEEGRIQMITFHQSYDYTDFVSGIRPSLDKNKGLSYELSKGPLYKIAQLAESELVESSKEGRTAKAFVLIIDEINRGNVAKVFGELITLIDEDKRWEPNTNSGLGIPLLYDDKDAKPFRLPTNLYIIGTMNSSDRSVQKLDSALRRRFNFDAVDPDPSLLKTEGSLLSEFVKSLNEKLENKRPRSGCQIGHAWFMKKGKPITEKIEIVEILNEKVFPLLEEWFWDDAKSLNAFFTKNSLNYLNKSGKLTFIKDETEKMEEFFKEFTETIPK